MFLELATTHAFQEISPKSKPEKVVRSLLGVYNFQQEKEKLKTGKSGFRN
jgi:hypothetical protein